MRKLLSILLTVYLPVLVFGQTLTTYEYDALNRLTKVTYAGGQVVQYSYDALGNRLSMSFNAMLPSVAGLITGNSGVCAGEQNAEYFVEEIENAQTYVWSLPQGASIVAGEHTNSIVVSFADNAESGSISVYGHNSAGDGPSSPVFYVTVWDAPQVSIAGDTAIYYGNSVTLTASGAETYLWSTDETTPSITVSPAVTATYSVTGYSENGCEAVAEHKVSVKYHYTINAVANPTAGGVTTGGGLYDEGTTVMLNAVANEGYTFINWSEGGNVVSTDAAYSFVAASNRNLVANFTLNAYDIVTTASPTEGGIVSGQGVYHHGDQVTLLATANSNYAFVAWKENGTVVSEQPQYSFTAASDRTLTAYFVPVIYNVTASCDPTTGGAITGTGDYQSGETVTLSVTPAMGHTFLYWSENDVLYSYATSFSFQVNGNRNFVAHFSVNDYEITAQANPAEGGTVTGSGIYSYNAMAELEAIQNEGWRFLNWTENGEVVWPNASYHFRVNGDRALQANYIRCYTINLSANPSNGGTTSGAGVYNEGDEVTISALAGTGYTFAYWSEGNTVLSNDPLYSFEASANRSIVANFVINTYTIVAEADPTDGGVVSGEGIYDFGQTAHLSATPNEGYVFSRWLENGLPLTTQTSFNVVVDRDRTFTAEFSIMTFEVEAYANPSMGGTITGTGRYDYGQTAVLSVVETEGYAFTNWTENGIVVSTDPTISFEVYVNRNLTANFVFDGVTQTMELPQGWNWWSTYIEVGNAEGLSMLENGLGMNASMIKSQSDGFVQNYYEQVGYNYWFGGLSSISNDKMYQINVSNDCTLEMTGYMAQAYDHPISLHPGWTWMGYPSNQENDVATAFNTYSAVNNDLIKDQENFCVYYEGFGWWPSNFGLIPGKGYMFFSNNSTSTSLTIGDGGRHFEPDTQELWWKANYHGFEDNTSIIAVVEVNGEEQQSANLELGAFMGGMCRGSAKLNYFAPLNRYFALLNVSGHDGETIEFYLVDETSGQMSAKSLETLTFYRNDIVGSLDKPYQIRFGEAYNLVESGLSLMTLYPNPVDKDHEVVLSIPDYEVVSELKIVNAIGAVIRLDEGGNTTRRIQSPHVAGVYVIQATCKSGNVYYERLIVK